MALTSYNDFDLDFYYFINDNLDFRQIKNKNDAYEDYRRNNKYRIASYNKNILIDFDHEIYLLCNKDIKKFNIKDIKYAKYHYIKYGYKEKRLSTIEQVEKILIDFNWIEYLYLYKHLLFQLNNKKDCILHYLINYIHLNKNYKSNKFICKDFNWIIYTNYYHDLNFIKNYKDAFQHYISVGIDEERIDWIYLQQKLFCINSRKYIELYPSLSNLSNNELIYNWIKNDKFGQIMPLLINNQNFNNTYGIAISVYSDKFTPIERLMASIKCLNYLFLLINNCNIYIIIDGSINENHFKFLKKLKSVYSNCFIYKNSKNYGISITKNICLTILKNNKNLKYFCLLDDDIFIKKDFMEYTINILNNYDIPILSNFNKALPFFEDSLENKCFIKSRFFFGNILIFTRKYFEKFGYFRIFPYKWGEEHVELTKRYMINSNYENYTIDFRKYFDDDFVFNNKRTLHLHSLKVDTNKVMLNKKIFIEFLKKIEYVDFDSEKYNFFEVK